MDSMQEIKQSDEKDSDRQTALDQKTKGSFEEITHVRLE